MVLMKNTQSFSGGNKAFFKGKYTYFGPGERAFIWQ
jgi:hypothetical protein